MTGQEVLNFHIERHRQEAERDRCIQDFWRLDGQVWSYNRLVGFTSAAGAAEFERLWPEYRTYVLAEKKEIQNDD